MLGFFRGVAILLAVMIAAPGLAQAEQRIALVIGNSAYGNGAWQALPNPGNDAQLMTQTLQGLGFKVTTLLNANGTAMEAAIKNLGIALNEAGPDSVGLFYFAGHGAQVDGRNYLIPNDARSRTQQDLFKDSVRMGFVDEWLANGGARVNFIILDACRTNNLPASVRDGSGGGLARIEKAQTTGTLIAYSAQPGASASDGVGRNSPYTAALAAALADKATPIELLFKRAGDSVRAATNGVQQPWYESGLHGADFCFGECKAGGIVYVAEDRKPKAEVSEAQTLLKKMDYYGGDIDGLISPALTVSVSNFMADALVVGSPEMSPALVERMREVAASIDAQDCYDYACYRAVVTGYVKNNERQRFAKLIETYPANVWKISEKLVGSPHFMQVEGLRDVSSKKTLKLFQSAVADLVARDEEIAHKSLGPHAALNGHYSINISYCSTIVNESRVAAYFNPTNVLMDMASLALQHATLIFRQNEIETLRWNMDGSFKQTVLKVTPNHKLNLKKASGDGRQQFVGTLFKTSDETNYFAYSDMSEAGNDPEMSRLFQSIHMDRKVFVYGKDGSGSVFSKCHSVHDMK